MTSWHSLLYCAAADVTLDRINNLVALTGTESLTVDFKEGAQTATIAECAAAMANAYGGLIFVGITDQGRDIVGVPREAMAHVADVLATHLESPDWAPEMIEVPLGDDKPDRYVLVLRINRDTAPRPVFVQGRGGRFWAPVRMPGSTRQATREELYALLPSLRWEAWRMTGGIFRLTGRGQADVDGFHPEGQANRSNIATLVWRSRLAADAS